MDEFKTLKKLQFAEWATYDCDYSVKAYDWLKLYYDTKESKPKKEKKDMKLNPYTFIVLEQPADEKSKTALVLGPELILAKDETSARLQIAKKIPETADLNRTEIVLKSF